MPDPLISWHSLTCVSLPRADKIQEADDFQGDIWSEMQGGRAQDRGMAGADGE